MLKSCDFVEVYLEGKYFFRKKPTVKRSEMNRLKSLALQNESLDNLKMSYYVYEVYLQVGSVTCQSRRD